MYIFIHFGLWTWSVEMYCSRRHLFKSLCTFKKRKKVQSKTIETATLVSTAPIVVASSSGSEHKTTESARENRGSLLTFDACIVVALVTVDVQAV